VIDRSTQQHVVIVATHWGEGRHELASVIRSVAAAVSRFARVSVLAPGRVGDRRPDGAFDVVGVGYPGSYRWPSGVDPACAAVVDEPAPDLEGLLSGTPVSIAFSLCGGLTTEPEAERDLFWQPLPLVRPVAGGPFVKVYVPVNPMAERDRHHGFGFTGYLLVLSGRTRPHDDPPDPVAWLTAAYPDRDILVIERATASAWKGRALRGSAAVETQMDLWRLVAHAEVCIDLAPGPLLARECVEAMRFGTPIIAPRGSGAAVTHAGAGGWIFASPDELIATVAQLRESDVRSDTSRRAKEYADQSYGNPDAFVNSLENLLALPGLEAG
jgi:hypothetical protein